MLNRVPRVRGVPSTRELAERALNANAIKFGENLRGDAGQAYPYFYAFVPSPWLDTSQGDSGNPAHLNTPTFAGQGPDGFDVPPAIETVEGLVPGMRDIIIRLDRDLNFDLLEARYSARIEYYDGAGIDRGGKYYYTVGSNVVSQDGFPRYLSHPYKMGVPTYEYLRVSLYLRSGQTRALYGGATTQQAGGDKTFGDLPLPVSAVQGLDDGKNVIRTPHLLSKESVVIVRCSNYFQSALRVNGYLFGYKVSH